MNYQIFDFHTHCFPDAIAPKTIRALCENAGIPAHHDGTAAGLARLQRDFGTAGYLVLPIATQPRQTRSILEFAEALNDKEGVYSFGSIHPFDPEYETWLDRIAGSGLRGVKFHPEYQDFFVDDERVWDVYEAIFKRDLLIIFHAGEDLGFSEPFHGMPERIAKLCERFPQGRIIAAHMGGFNRWGEVLAHLAGRRNLWLDTSFSAGMMPDELFAELARAHGLDRILFGTDSPWRTLTASVQAVLHGGFSEEDNRAIFYENAKALLAI